MPAVLFKVGLQDAGVVIAGVVEDQVHRASRAAMAQQLVQEALEGCRVEYRAEHNHEPSGAHLNSAKAGDALSCRGVQNDRVLVLGRHPHGAAAAVLLEMALVQTPQVNLGVGGQLVEFF